MKRTIAISYIFIFMILPGHAQESTDLLNIVKAESQLRPLFNALYDLDNPMDKERVYQMIDSIFQSALEKPGSFDYAWGKLDNIGKLKSDDGRIKVFSWLYMKSRDEYKYSCYMQVDKGKGKSDVYKLVPSESMKLKSENLEQQITNWHPKVYYQIITHNYKRKTFYTLLGADFNNSRSSIKTVEVVAIQRGKPVFRGAQFLVGGTVKNRLVFEYSSEVAMSLRYNSQLNRIVFDHLSPLHPIYTGSREFYGPDGSYDALKFVEGIWLYDEDVDARNN